MCGSRGDEIGEAAVASCAELDSCEAAAAISVLFVTVDCAQPSPQVTSDPSRLAQQPLNADTDITACLNEKPHSLHNTSAPQYL